MKTILFSLVILLSVLFLKSQEVYTLSGVNGNSIQFSSIDELQSQKTLFKAQEDLKSTQFSYVNERFDGPNSVLTAAMAYDPVSNNVIYMPMMSTSVYMKNLSTGTLQQIKGGQNISATTCNQGTQYSRMALGADGNAYALSNDFQELIQINPKTKQVNNLGSIVLKGYDPITDKKVWGGDMIADSQNNLYIIAASGNIFKINVNSNEATSLGKLSGLPEDFTTNGAAVLADGSIIVSNAKGNGVYIFTLDNLRAELYANSKTPSYDLASRFVVPVSASSNESLITQNGLQIYPTVIDQSELNIKANQDFRKLTVRVYDLNSYLVDEFKLRNLNEGKAENLALRLQPNLYIVKIFDENNSEVLNQKVTVTN